MEGLSFDNILGENEIETMFIEPEETATQEEEAATGEKENPGIENSETDKTTEVVDPEDLFIEEMPEEAPKEKEEEKKSESEQPESVGSGDNQEGKGDATTEGDSGTSPNENFYSSIANALAVDGIFPNLDDETIKKVDDAESFSNLIEAEVNARFNEEQQRILNALKNGVEPTDIRRYESTLNYINSITEEQLTEESEKGEELRKNLIYQDFLNKGYSPEKAQKFTMRTVSAGTDVEDAKEALQGNREFFQNSYNELIENAQKEAEEEKAVRQKLADKVKDSILKDKQLLGDIEITESSRKKAYDAIFKPVYKDPESGKYLTALQKYQAENESDFLKYAGLMFTLTNGFKDFSSFAKGEVKKGVNKAVRELEHTLTNTRRSNDGSLKMVTGVKEDPESFFKGIKLDL